MMDRHRHLGTRMVDHLHCFQYDFATSAKAAGAVPAWLAEGAAAWVGEQVSIGSTLGEEYWEDWLKVPERSLFGRTYDGMGFLMHLADSGIDPWPILVSMHRKGESSSVDAYSVAVKGAAASRMIDAWGPSYIRHDTLKPDWSTDGLGLPTYVSTPIVEAAVGATDSYILDVAPEAAAAAKLDVRSDVIVFEGRDSRGMVRFEDGSQWSLKDILGKPVCLKADACACPAGSAGHAWMTASKGQVLLGLSGHTDGAHVVIDGFDVDETCEHPPQDFRPEEPCWCPPGALGLVGPSSPRSAFRSW
jgi:hypothetical protein